MDSEAAAMSITAGFVEIVCPICETVTAVRALATDKERRIVVCRRCDLAFVQPQPDASYLDAIYSAGYFSGSDAATGYQDYTALSGLLTDIAAKNIRTIT